MEEDARIGRVCVANRAFMKTSFLILLLTACCHASDIRHIDGTIVSRESSIGVGRKGFPLRGSLVAVQHLKTSDRPVDPHALDPAEPGNSFGCVPVHPVRNSNWVALVERGGCAFADKVRAMQSSGAIAVIVGDSASSTFDGDRVETEWESKAGVGRKRAGLVTMVAAPGSDAEIVIPSYFVARKDYAVLLRLAGFRDHAQIAHISMNDAPAFSFLGWIRRALNFRSHTSSDDSASDMPMEPPTLEASSSILISPTSFGQQLYLLGIFLCGPIMASLTFQLSLLFVSLKRKWDSAATARFVARMPVKVWSVENMLGLEQSFPNTMADDRPMCSICIEEFLVGDRLRCLPCNHSFHAECVDRWLVSVVNTCPLCKQCIQTAPRKWIPKSNPEPIASNRNTAGSEQSSTHSQSFRQHTSEMDTYSSHSTSSTSDTHTDAQTGDLETRMVFGETSEQSSSLHLDSEAIVPKHGSSTSQTIRARRTLHGKSPNRQRNSVRERIFGVGARDSIVDSALDIEAELDDEEGMDEQKYCADPVELGEGELDDLTAIVIGDGSKARKTNMLDLTKVGLCQTYWLLQSTTTQSIGKQQLNCTSDSWELSSCYLFSSGHTSLLYAFDTLIITQSPFDPKSRSFTNLTSLWSFNASQELTSNFSTQPQGFTTAKLTKYGLFGFDVGNSAYLYNLDGVSTTSTRVGFCFEDQEPYVSYRDVAGNTFWSPQNATRYTYGPPPLLYNPIIRSNSINIRPEAWVGISFGVLVLICIVIAVQSARKKSAASNAEHTTANSFDMNQPSLNRHGDQEGLPLYKAHETGSNVASLNSTVHAAFPQGTSAAQGVAARRGVPGWTVDDVVAWVRLNVGNDSFEEVVRKEKIDGSVIETLDVDDILNSFTFGTKAERESMRSALVSLKSRK
ncbi:hypothetical protein HDU80_011558 [Chytriomyces hyalinus]|nr:hypothetical protein HDU80_011558 [Chytriomyces hyalinus]